MKKSLYNNENPMFFLFTCVKDGRNYISKLFESLLKQTKVNFIHYIYEDGSKDTIEDLVDDYKNKSAKLNKPISIIYEKNSINIGLNMATKHCIELCDKPYFLWLNCDDWVDVRFFEELENYILKNNGCSVYVSNMRFHCGENVFFRPRDKYERYLITYKSSMNLLLSNGLFFNYSCFNYKDFLEINRNVTFIDKRDFFNDEQVIVPFAFWNKKFCFCKKAITDYNKRLDSESFANSTSADKSGNYIELLKLLNIENADDFFKIFKTINDSKLKLSAFNKQHDYKNLKVVLTQYIKFLKENFLYSKVFYFGKKSFAYWKIKCFVKNLF